MSDATEVKENEAFPGEAAEPANESATQEDTPKKGKWAVAESDGEGLKIRCEGFSLQTEADAWIKGNIAEGEVLVAVRLGVPRKLEVVRKLAEVEL